MDIGDRVKVSSHSDYYRQQTEDAANTTGTIAGGYDNRAEWFRVNFDNGYSNGYPKGVLVLTEDTRKQKILGNVEFYHGFKINIFSIEQLKLLKLITKRIKNRISLITTGDIKYPIPKSSYKSRKYTYIVLGTGPAVVNSLNAVFINLNNFKKSDIKKVKPSLDNSVRMEGDVSKIDYDMLKGYKEINVIGSCSGYFYVITHPILTRGGLFNDRWAIIFDKNKGLRYFFSFNKRQSESSKIHVPPHPHIGSDVGEHINACLGEYERYLKHEPFNKKVYWALDFVRNTHADGDAGNDYVTSCIEHRGDLSEPAQIKEVKQFIQSHFV